jgi:DNA-binding MarR family transcriptional regulator
LTVTPTRYAFYCTRRADDFDGAGLVGDIATVQHAAARINAEIVAYYWSDDGATEEPVPAPVRRRGGRDQLLHDAQERPALFDAVVVSAAELAAPLVVPLRERGIRLGVVRRNEGLRPLPLTTLQGPPSDQPVGDYLLGAIVILDAHLREQRHEPWFHLAELAEAAHVSEATTGVVVELLEERGLLRRLDGRGKATSTRDAKWSYVTPAERAAITASRHAHPSSLGPDTAHLRLVEPLDL